MAGGNKSGKRYWETKRNRQWYRLGGKIGSAYEKPSISNVAQAAWSGVKYLRTLVNSEVHKLDTNPTTLISSTGYVTHLSGIAQGDGVNQRTGLGILAKGLSARGVFWIHASASTSQVRVIYFIDLQQIADTTPGVTDVLTGSFWNAHYNTSNVGRFKILSDTCFGLSANGPQQKIFKHYFKLNRHIRYNGTAATDQQKGAVYILLISNEGTNLVGIDLHNRISWHDN